MKRFRKALGIVALALVVSLSLAMPASAWADKAESYGKPTVSGPQSAWYNGQSHHFRSTVKDSVSGEDLVEGTDFTRSFGFISDRGNADGIDTWLATDDSFVSSGFVYERIDFKGNYSGSGSYFVRHNILTLYEFKELNATKVEGEADPTLGATLSLFVGDPTTLLDLSAFSLSREAGEQPGEYAITYTTDPEQIPEAYTSNSAGTRTGLGEVDLGDGYISRLVVGDDICGYNYIRIVPATLTIVPAYTDVSATIAWKDSSNKDGLRPSAEDYAKLLSPMELLPISCLSLWTMTTIRIPSRTLVSASTPMTTTASVTTLTTRSPRQTSMAILPTTLPSVTRVSSRTRTSPRMIPATHPRTSPTTSPRMIPATSPRSSK